MRILLGATHEKDVTTRYSWDDKARANDPLSNQQVQDRKTVNSHTYYGRVGYQHFLNTGRLRGFAGADAGVGFGKRKAVYEYGNAMTELNTNPTSAFFSWRANERVLEVKQPDRLLISGGAFTGAEYYLAHGIALGIEVGVRYNHYFSNQSYEKFETMVGTERIEMDEAQLSDARTSQIPTYTKFYLSIDF